MESKGFITSNTRAIIKNAFQNSTLVTPRRVFKEWEEWWCHYEMTLLMDGKLVIGIVAVISPRMQLKELGLNPNKHHRMFLPRLNRSCPRYIYRQESLSVGFDGVSGEKKDKGAKAV
ncbi:hypothetical protein CEXT_240491 [Caerostris extrusa]|uniref:Uncharacterized protein n=1 Tax=Caerostris extrusa TaxID=172846 RepID=A0AAV4WF91_CAEEX|nr:hypothetical protein CEXT_240491 [Caerostris extrusa]